MVDWEGPKNERVLTSRTGAEVINGCTLHFRWLHINQTRGVQLNSAPNHILLPFPCLFSDSSLLSSELSHALSVYSTTFVTSNLQDPKAKNKHGNGTPLPHTRGHHQTNTHQRQTLTLYHTHTPYFFISLTKAIFFWTYLVPTVHNITGDKNLLDSLDRVSANSPHYDDILVWLYIKLKQRKSWKWEKDWTCQELKKWRNISWRRAILQDWWGIILLALMGAEQVYR